MDVMKTLLGLRPRTDTASPAEADGLADRRLEHLDAATAMSATTLAGMVAKARGVHGLVNRDMSGNMVGGGLGADLAWSLVEDLMRLGNLDPEAPPPRFA